MSKRVVKSNIPHKKNKKVNTYRHQYETKLKRILPINRLAVIKSLNFYGLGIFFKGVSVALSIRRAMRSEKFMKFCKNTCVCVKNEFEINHFCGYW